MSEKKFDIRMSDLIGQKDSDIRNIYNFQEKLAEGGFSHVYLATHKVTGIIRCIKKIKKSQFKENQEEDVMNEIKILKEIDHPNILKIMEYYITDKYLYIVMEYLSGGDLFNKITAMKSFSEVQVVEIMRQLLSAVSYLHKNNIIHRDLKPENIVFESPNEKANLKIIDFGTSKRINIEDKLETRIGSAYYIAPEVLKGCYNVHCDIWSCGVIMYILLCGYPPFAGKTTDELYKSILKGKFGFINTDWKNKSITSKDMIKAMLNYEPHDRPSADELLKSAWFDQVDFNSDPNEESLAMKNLKNFYSQQKLQKAIFLYIVNFFDIVEEKNRLLDIFKSMDEDQDGILSRQELLNAYLRIYDYEKAQKEVESIIERLDFNKTNAIDFNEFLVANINFKKTINEEKLKQIFKILDIDQNGYITVQELKSFFNFRSNEHDQFVKDLIQEVDKNKDGLIGYDEFIFMMNEFLKNIK